MSKSGFKWEPTTDTVSIVPEDLQTRIDVMEKLSGLRLEALERKVRELEPIADRISQLELKLSRVEGVSFTCSGCGDQKMRIKDQDTWYMVCVRCSRLAQ